MESIINYILQANLYLVGFFLIYMLLFRKQQNINFNRAFLLGSISLSLLFPLIKLKEVHFIPSEVILPEIIIGEITRNNAIEASTFDLWTLLSTVYFSGLLFLLFRFGRQFYLLRKLVQSGERYDEFYLLPNSSTAFSFFNYIIIGKEIPEKERQLLVEHESIHSKRLHSIDILCCHLLEMVFWFNPLTFFLKRLFREIHEYEADALSKANPENYIELLLQQSFGNYELSFIHSFNSTHLKQRIMRITNQHPPKMKKRNI